MKINDRKITKEFCAGRVLIFFPASEDEAAFILRQLTALGAQWSGESIEAADLEKCVRKGMNLDNGAIYAAAPQADIEKGFLCTARQFDKEYLSPHEQLMQKFNALAAKVEEIYRELKPARLDKPLTKKPGQQP